MVILIIGSQGQLGMDVQKVLSGERIDFHPSTRNEMDITNKDEVKKLVNDLKPSSIINCAALHNVALCESQPELAYETNAIAVGNLAQICAKKDIKFMTMSTDYVFDGKTKTGYTEEDTPSPLMWHGKSKLVGEWLAMTYNPKTFVVRTQSLYGLTGPRGKKTNFVDLMVKLSKKDEIKVDQYVMSPTWTYPLAKHMVSLLATNNYGITHISCNGATTWYEFAKEIINLIGSNTKVTKVGNDYFKKNFERPENSYLINRRLKELGTDFMPNWKDALKEYMKLKYGV